MNISQILGFLGTGLIIYAYIPQIQHLIKEQCSAGISKKAYTLWLIASIMLLTHAYMIFDIVFMVLNAANAILTGIIIFFANKYQGSFCSTHKSH